MKTGVQLKRKAKLPTVIGFKIQKRCKFTWQQFENDISCAAMVWIKLCQMERFELSNGPMKVRKNFTYRIHHLNWRALVKYFGKF